MDRSKAEKSRDIDLNCKINELDLVDKYRSFHSRENKDFLRAHMVQKQKLA